MKLTPLLDHWQKPANAGDPLAVLATTFTLEWNTVDPISGAADVR